MKRILTLAATLLMMASIPALAQNVQLHYDFGSLLYRSGEKDLSTSPAVRPSLTAVRCSSFISSRSLFNVQKKRITGCESAAM